MEQKNLAQNIRAVEKDRAQKPAKSATTSRIAKNLLGNEAFSLIDPASVSTL